MENAKIKAEKLIQLCEKEGLAATIAISNPEDINEKGFVGNTGNMVCVLANLTGALLEIEQQSGVSVHKILRDVRAAANKYKYGGLTF